MKTDHLLFGAAYYSEYLPYDRVEKDMEMMEKAGMNTIRIAESTWSTIEPKDGIFDFTHLDKMLEAAARHHISVIVGTPTYAIPAWLAKKYPDILALTNNGQNIYGARQNMDITHAGYLFHCERVIRAMMEHIKDVPHIIGFQLDNETKSYGTAGLRVQAMFVDYLKEKYPDINEFNREFGLDYWSNRVNTWEDFPDVRGTINESLAAEFAKFQRLLVTRFLTWQASIVSGYKRPDQFITQNFDFDWTDHSIGYQPEVNQYEAARCMTVAGCDIYHPSQSLLTGEEITFCGNISRSLKKDNYLVLETQLREILHGFHIRGSSGFRPTATLQTAPTVSCTGTGTRSTMRLRAIGRASCHTIFPKMRLTGRLHPSVQTGSGSAPTLKTCKRKTVLPSC